jgi:hypothetical protein
LYEYGTDVDDNWFQQDGAKPHTAVVLEFLDEIFDNRVVSNLYPEMSGKRLAWPPLSPDLNHLIFSLELSRDKNV